jgi:hypothetical protein
VIFFSSFQQACDVRFRALLQAATVQVPPSKLSYGRAIAQNGGLLGALGTWAEVLTDLAGLSVA